MKKHRLMLPILAVIAGVAASAFTTTKYVPTNTDTPRYWYIVNSSNQSVVNTEVNPDGKLTAQEAIDQGKIPCVGSSPADCARGFDNLITSTTTSPGQEQIHKP